VFVIEVKDEEQRLSLERFLAFKVPGLLFREGDRLQVVVRGALTPEAQQRLLERLLWAWQIEQQVDPRITVRLTHLADATNDAPLAIDHEHKRA
jgi:hypothetical protein